MYDQEKITNEIIKIIEKLEFGRPLGLRAVTENPVIHDYETLKIGDIPPNSYVWDDGDSTGEEINGTCAALINWDIAQWGDKESKNHVSEVVRNVIKYYDSYHQIVLLIAENDMAGNDVGEVVLYDNVKVIGVWSN